MRMLGNIWPQVNSLHASIEVHGLSADSREIKKGFVFAALPGTVVDGAKFIDKAVANGAVAVIVQTGVKTNVGDNVAVIEADEPRQALALMAADFYAGQPDCIAAVTGTNGKSSIVAFVRQIWQSMGLRAASLGTVGIDYPGGFEKLAHTTPDPVSMQKALEKLAKKSVTHLALEASSHGLEQHRLDGIQICVGGFTNFSQDHLDYHKTFEAYFAAKMRLFDELLAPGSAAVINVDSDKAAEVLARVKARGLRILTVGKAGEHLKLLSQKSMALGQLLEIQGVEQTYKVFLPLVGAFQAENALVAAGLVIAAGGSEAIAIKSLEDLRGAKGRLELVDRSKDDAAIFVDFAHTPDALKLSIQALRPFADGKLVVVFGCGGDRDKGKRPLMGKVAADFADVVYVTDDNPRGEDPSVIRSETMAGCPDAVEIGDRSKAIETAIKSLEKGDVLLIAGKGHEEGQIVGDKIIPFTDHEAVFAVTRGVAA